MKLEYIKSQNNLADRFTKYPNNTLIGINLETLH